MVLGGVVWGKFVVCFEINLILYILGIINHKSIKMKTKLSLTIIGVIMILQSIAYPLFSETFIEMMFNVGDEAKEVLNLFQIAVAPTFLMIGLLMLMARSAELKTAKNILLAFIIGYIPAFLGFYYLASSPMTNAGVTDFIPDILMFGLAIFTYIKPKS